MLSSEHPSGPSCSSKTAGPGVSADPATSVAEEPASQDPRDLVQPYPKFSIRDYVFASRSKGVKRSWPFNPRSLQLCVRRGVTDPLPPFEPPDLIRSQPLSNFTDAEQSAGCSEAITSVRLVKTRDASSSNEDTSNINFQPCQPVDDSLGPSPYTSPEDGKSGIDHVGSTNESDHTNEEIPIDLQDNSCTKASQRTEVVVPSWRSRNLDSSCEPSERKSKFSAKVVGTSTDIRRTEDIASNSSSVSDPMASKTCPVCKVFASTSNTTLNAHIDQCLSAESNTEFVETVLVKPKVKPRKKRLMVDIYKTALPCTLEDLDRRNGTNWAVELAMSTVNKDVCTENRSPEVVPFDRRDDEREGDVYVDSNGIKIRILSKRSDAPLVLKDDVGSSKAAKNETEKGILMSKKIPKSKISKNKKPKMHTKKYNKTNHLNSQVPEYSHDDINEETSDEEQHAQNPSDSTSNGSGTMRQWVCSKRSDIGKNFSRKFSDKVTSRAQKSDRSSMIGFNDSQIPESPGGVFSSESPEDMATTSEAIGVDKSNGRFLRSIPTWSSKTPLQSGVVRKVPRSAAAVAKRKIKEIGRREANKLDNYDIVRNSTSAKRYEARSLSFTAGPSNGPNRLVPTSKKIRKHRSVLRTSKCALSPSVNRLVHGFDQDHEPDTRHVNKKFRVSDNEGPKKFVNHTEEDTADTDFSFGSDMPDSRQQDGQYDIPQETEGTEMEYEGEEPGTDVPFDSVSRSYPADCQISDGSLSPENNTAADDVLVEGYSVAVEDPSSSEQLARHGHESSSAVNNETEEWQIDPASTKESSDCLTNNRDMGPGAPQDNSSITSNREDSSQEHGLPLGRDSLDSPISTASTFFPPDAKKDPRINQSAPGPSTAEAVEELATGSLNQETKSIPTAREGEQLPSEKPFCCSCRESISREPHQSAVARPPMLNFTGKQIPQLNIGLRASSSFSTYQRTSTKPNPCLDSNDHPLVPKVSAESSMNLQSFTTDCMSPPLQTQLPSPSNPILRLMGKNLMVMNNEESTHSQPPSSDYILRGNYAAPVGFMPPNYQHLSNSAFINTPPASVTHQIPLPTVQASSFVGPPLHGGSVMQSDHHAQQKTYRNIMPVMHHPSYMMKEVIVIDDSPERRSEPQVSMLLPPAPSPIMSVPNTMPPRPFYCLPPQSPILPRNRAVGSMPVYTNVGSMVGVGSSSQGNHTEVANPYMQNPFYVQSPTGYINPPVYYSQNLR
ncbi:hypothetical protein HU200_027592 [Digitaria exilis]|uniref:Hapless 8 n=1 Tax=Digitaria exilis TaxID=1010633 RepID=A0A835BWB6_9POAL|nr:hypothetical protein HU200_027592 [Digitaria exilis]